MTYQIGIDMGGSFTDAVVVDAHGLVVAAAKVPTQDPPTTAIGRALDRLLSDSTIELAPSDIGLVSLSTTMATNALVEGTGEPVGLVFIGFEQAEAHRSGLARTLGDGPLISARGGHDAHGQETDPLDLETIVNQASAAADRVDAFAVSARFGVRNPAHEQMARQALLPLGKPITCGHELAADLDGPRRALTCVLNAGLTGLIRRLCSSATEALRRRDITCPLLIVRSDGSVMSAEVAAERPIETILSGPAASLAGAAHLFASLSPPAVESPAGGPPVGDLPAQLVVADIGGTTTDIGLVHYGRPRVSDSGANIGGHATMVEAVEVHTIGLGGDSLVELNLRGQPELIIGPRRVRPLSDLAAEHPSLVNDALGNIQLPYRPGDTTFVSPRALTGVGHPLTDREQALLDQLFEAAEWQPLSQAAPRRLDRENLDRLLAKGRISLAGFTPTDAALVVGLYKPKHRDSGPNSDRLDAALGAAAVLASASTTQGEPVRATGIELAQWVVDTVARRSAEAILAATMTSDGLDAQAVYNPLIQKMLDRRYRERLGDNPIGDASSDDALSISVAPRGTLIGLGAGSSSFHPQAAALLSVPTLSPEHAAVAGAIGAAIGGVRVTAKATITQPTRGQFRLHLPASPHDLGDLQRAIDEATSLLTDDVEQRALRAGAAKVDLAVEVKQRTAEIGGKTLVVEATVTVTGTGPPRTAGQ